MECKDPLGLRMTVDLVSFVGLVEVIHFDSVVDDEIYLSVGDIEEILR